MFNVQDSKNQWENGNIYSFLAFSKSKMKFCSIFPKKNKEKPKNENEKKIYINEVVTC